ncbi:MAG: ABC transporter ATP-binding protein [Pseudolabrys sp.]|nr:ABC transporter ATP-binding protein [Pseudolabrys sp.]
MNPVLDIEQIEVRYGGVTALRDVSLQVAPGQAVALLGANGAGKSTLLKTVIGLMRARTGDVRFDGRSIAGLPPQRRARLGVGYCPEGRRTFPGLQVRENLMVACWEGRAERERRVEEMFSLFPALRQKADHLAWQLSGGQQQMLAIGRSLMGRPRLLLLDEPSLGLSPVLTDEVIGRIPAIKQTGTAILLAEQNAAKALAVCDHAYVLQTGKVVGAGPAGELARSADVRKAFLGG